MSYFATNLKKLRKSKRLSQSKFAEIFGLTRATVGAYEEGRAEPKLDKIIEIANYFGLSVDQLISKKLSVNEIFHYDQKTAFLQGRIPFVSLADKKNFLQAFSAQQTYKYSYINIPGVVADIALEVESFAGLKNCIVFGKNISKNNSQTWYISIFEDDYVFSFGSPKNNALKVWQICCVFTKDLQHLATELNYFQQINNKLDLLINLQKQSKKC